jgi:sugar/nucleoside kinase (ribokinase family)
MNLEELADWIEQHKGTIAGLRAVTGFDGFVDEMITVVDEREDLDRFRRVEDISRFGDLVKQAAGHSSLREIVVTATHPGGCAVNMGDGLAALGVAVDTFATLGEPVHPAFAEYGRLARLYSWGREPGRTLAFEFADGKLMFSAVTQLADFNAQAVRGYLESGDYLRCCERAPLIALTDWTLYPHMTAVWRLLNREVFARLTARPWLFVDLVDPSSRSVADIRDMLTALAEFGANCRVALGLNQNEANIVSRILDIEFPDRSTSDSSLSQAAALREALGVEQVVVHAHAYAVCAENGRATAVDGPYCASPRKSTGAGDRFNAGYALGLMLQLPVRSCLHTAVAGSGFFVRNARSASSDELATFVRAWAAGDPDAAAPA